MSVPSTDLVCSKCESKGSDAGVQSDFRYVEGSREIPLSRTLGWCADCCDFVPTKDFAVKDELLSEIDEALRPIIVRAKGWTSFALLGRTRKRRMNAIDMLSGLIANQALIGERKGMEKCLHCGSVNVERFDRSYSKSDSYAAKSATENTGFFHTGCGGESLASGNPVRLNMIFEPRLYSVDGHRLDRET
jgi:hypothetical protein